MLNFSPSVLDCTLRDGGYLNDWKFGINAIKSIVNNLNSSGVDYIECGFLKDSRYSQDRTIFSSVSELDQFIIPNQKYTLMVNYGEYDIQNFNKCKNKNIKVRVAFKKHNQKEALDYIKILTNLGWDVFVNPMITNIYSQEELTYLITEINKIAPYGVTIVDTLGNMFENDIIEIFEFINRILDRRIALGFHSHNNLQLSFSNTKTLLNLNIQRPLIIDSCLYGIGRGAGNLCTELITQYLNDNFAGKYQILPILKSIDFDLKPIYQNAQWGYSTPYYISAINNCHPNYAGYLVQKQFSDEEINKIISLIPKNQRISFDKNLIENLAKNFF